MIKKVNNIKKYMKIISNLSKMKESAEFIHQSIVDLYMQIKIRSQDEVIYYYYY
jgi:hypothetical protein